MNTAQVLPRISGSDGDDLVGIDVTSPIGHVLPESPRSASLARALVREALSDLPISIATVETAQVLVSELVTNAVLHARSMLVLHVRSTGDRLHIAVEDLSTDYPLAREPVAGAENGRGLLLLDALASSWGWDQTPVGKNVWCELPVVG